MKSAAPDSYAATSEHISEQALSLWREYASLPHYVSTVVDPLGMSTPIFRALGAWVLHPMELTRQLAEMNAMVWRLQQHVVRRACGFASEDPLPARPDDARFKDPVWTDAVLWDAVKETYLAVTRGLQDMLYNTPGLDVRERRKAAFWWRMWLNMIAPTNFLPTNPVAQRKALQSGGTSLLAGARVFLDDLRAGDVQMNDNSAFKLGKNVATTPGAVIARFPLVEIIHYTPTQKTTFATPIVIVTPWITQVYILDLSEKKSMVRYLLDQGYEVFITSWKNPDEELRDTSFEDYVVEGVHAAIDTACRFAGVRKVHAVGYCIGGTALTTYLAWANRQFAADEVPVADWTLFTTLADFSAPGDIEVFVDEATVNHLSREMVKNGYLDGKNMAMSFRMLRSNSLIWHYVVHGWLYGETPPAFDVLFWNTDSTRMPAAMHEWYLRELYLANRLIEADALTIGGQPIDLGRIAQPLYSVAAQDDHIAPWQQVFRTLRHISADKRFVLSSSGHILGIINPPVDPPKRSHRASAAQCGDEAQAWLARTESAPDSWWPDWMKWLKPRSGRRTQALPLATDDFPALDPAPGRYVLE